MIYISHLVMELYRCYPLHFSLLGVLPLLRTSAGSIDLERLAAYRVVRWG